MFFSGGLSSFAVAHHLKQSHPDDNILLYFTDTMFEDEDLYRFIEEASEKLELPLLIHADGRNPLELMEQDNFLYNSRIANCSLKLKSAVAKRWLKNGIVPNREEWRNKQFLKHEDVRDRPVLYFGINFMEMHRQDAIIQNWRGFQVEMPLIQKHYDTNDLLALYNIRKPRLYLKGFSHNNCKGRCVKGGQAHWLNLLRTDYESFSQMRDFETKMNERINATKPNKTVYAFIKRNGANYTLKQLEEDYNNFPDQIDMFDIGGCGCFIEEQSTI